MTIKVTEQDDAAAERWLFSDMKLVEAFALYRMELLEESNDQLGRCFKGDTISVRNEIILKALKEETERVLALPQEDIREYLSKKFD